MTRWLALLLALTCSSFAHSQSNVRIRATITALEGDVLSVRTRDGRDLQLHLAPDAAVATAKAITLAELPSNAYVGVTAVKKGERLVALEVHTIPPQAAAGITPSDLEAGATMNNASLSGVAKASGGNEITLQFKDGAAKILVPDGTPVVTSVAADRSALKPGEYVYSNARQEADGRIVAQRITASKDGVRPPQ
jgi:hypothetical protein